MTMTRATMLIALATLLGSPAAGRAQPPERSLFVLTNGYKEEVQLHLRYVTTGGVVKALKNDVAVKPGEKAGILVPGDILTAKVEGKPEILYYVAIRLRRQGFPELWYGVKSQGGEVKDKNEFTGMRFNAVNIIVDEDGKKVPVRLLSDTLRPPPEKK